MSEDSSSKGIGFKTNHAHQLHATPLHHIHVLTNQRVGGTITHLILQCVFFPELGTFEWINFNPDFLIRISTVETFLFSPYPLYFSRSLDIRKLFSPMRIFLFSHWLPAFLWLAAAVSLMITVFHTLLR